MPLGVLVLGLLPGCQSNPHIIDSDPRNGLQNVEVTASVSLSPSVSVDPATVGPESFQLLDPQQNQIAGNYNSDAAGGVLSFTPSARLNTNTTYTIRTTGALRDESGTPFAIFTASFRTGVGGVPAAPYPYSRVVAANVDAPTVVTTGPDGKLYVATGGGDVWRYTLGANGLPTASQRLTPFGATPRTILGLTFDPRSTGSNLMVWLSHGVAQQNGAANFTGKVSLSTGPNLATTRDVITGLPRSIKDHMNNGVVFGPDGRLYIAQGSITGYGAPDQYWGNRSESPLSASILVADVINDPRFLGTVNVNTSTGYNPNVPTAPVRLYAEGTRNPYDMVWHTNGSLYVPVNEAAGGNTPAGPGGNPPALVNLLSGKDFLARVREGRYYGHPNPTQSHYVLNGGNPTGGSDYFETPQYPVGTNPDSDWDKPILNFGNHRSPNGLIEFTGTVWGATPRGDLLVTEFSNGDDLILLALDSVGNSAGWTQLAAGFNNPLDVTMAPNNDLYVIEYGDMPYGSGGRVTLLRPTATSTTPVARFNFQPQTAPVPSGYTADWGRAYDAGRGYGWIAKTTTAPLSLVGNGVDRNIHPDQRLDTYVAMQCTSGCAVNKQGRWEYALPNGVYDVTVSVGDPGAFNSDHRIFVETTPLIGHLVPNAGMTHANNTVRVRVNDGRLTVSPDTGKNTKINYVHIDAVI